MSDFWGSLKRRLPVAVVVGLLTSMLVMLGAAAPAKAAGTTNVACGAGGEAALIAAINAANVNADADTINITGGPCIFSLTTPQVVAAGANNTGLPYVTNELTILGNGSTIERAGGAALQFRVMFAFAKLTLQDLTIRGGRLTNQAAAGLGGIGAAISLDRVTVTDNAAAGTTAAAGGGLWTSGGTLAVDHSTISGNVAVVSSAMSLNGTPATIRRSVLSTNNANTASGSAGVWIQGGTVTFENDTFANNTATNTVGGVVVSNAGATAGIANFDSSTFSGNGSSIFRLPVSGGVVTINVARTIVAGTCTGPIVNGAGNIESPGSSCGFGAGNTIDPKLAPLAANGGPTQTMRPLFDSPAIDRIVGACLATDQRDVARADGGGCDTGAYETPSPETTASGTVGVTNNPQVTFSSPDTAGATFECAVNAGGFSACTSPFSPAVGTGSHTVLVRAVEPTGGYLDKTPASVSLNVDKTAPVVTITPAPVTPTPDDTPTISFTVNDPSAAVTCAIDAVNQGTCSSPYTTPPLTQGSHTITVSATDAATNVGNASTTIFVDLAPSNTIPVPCSGAVGDVTALKNAITAANATFAHDTIDVTGGPCTFTLTTVADPAAGGNGLPVVVHPLTVEGHGSTIARSTVSGTPNFRIWFASGFGGDTNTSLTLHDLTITGGSLLANNVGGGVAGLAAAIRLDRVSLVSNAGGPSGSGGGLATIGGTLDIDHSMIFFNTAFNGGGLSTNLTPATVRRSLIFGNAATSSTGGALIQGLTVNFENTTVAGNVAANAIGGIAVIPSGATPGVVNVESSTLYNNRKTNLAAPANALFAGATDAIHVRNSIVTDDSAAAAAFAPCSGPVTNDGGNLEWPGTTCGFGTNANPQLGALLAYPAGASGYPLLPSSPAIDLGGASCPATDQFDKVRPDGAFCDTGALEAPEPETLATGPATDPTNNTTITFSSPDTPTATFQCKVDAGAFATCTSPFTPVLTDGSHTILVRAVAAGGYPDRTPASVTFVVDKTAPVVDITSAPPAPPSVTGDNTATIVFTVNDPSAAVICKVDALPAATCASPFTTDPLADGAHTILVTATDPVGNAGSDSVTFIVDTVPSAIIDVPCGDAAALRAAITAANATLAADTINVTGGPCTFTLNDSVDATAGGNGLPIVIHPLTVEGHGATIERSAVGGTPNFRIWFVWGNVDSGASLTLRDLTVLRGSLVGNNVGAGVAALLAQLNLDGVIIQQNIAAGGSANGAGVWIFDGTLAIEDSSFYFNQSATGAALATTLTPGTVSRSTFFFNAAASGAAAWVQGDTVTFENSTISSNVANNGIGGIIASNSGATSGVVNIVSSTLFAQRQTNVAAPGGHLFAFHQTGTGTETINVTDSIVSDPSTATPVLAACTGVTDGAGNIEWPGTSCGFGTNADPQLDPTIALNGGTTLNYRLLPGSPAIDLGGATCPATDQRGVARPDGDACDAGSYETPAPDTIATAPVANPTNNPQITFSSPDTPTATFQCKVDAGAFATCVSPFTPVVGDGPHTVLVRAVDAGGYVDPSPASVSFDVDRTAPVVDITSAPASPTNDSTPTISFTVDDPAATVECQVDGGARVACASPFTSGVLAEGFHSFKVYATDTVGNEGSDSVTIAISFGPPDTVIDTGPSGTIYNQPSSTFTFHSTKANSTFECNLDSGPYVPCTSPRTISGYTNGPHTFRVRAVDVAGVRDPTPASRAFTVKTCTILRISIDLFGNPTVLCL